MEKTYNVNEAAEIIGVSVKTLQRWDRDGKLVANRTPSNRRYYTEKQLKEVCLNNLEDNNMSIKESIKNMKIGDVITIEFKDEAVEYITKTNWFDTVIFIVGGLGRTEMPVIVGWGFEEEEIDIDAVVKKIEEVIDEDFKVGRNEGEITLAYKAGEVFRNFNSGNFYYRK